MKKVEIKTPCHESWDSFTPTEQGGFCASCQKEVIDFSKQSNEEIYNTLKKDSQGKICGRFEVTQLNSFNNDYLYWLNAPKPSFQSRFVLALILVFGMGLFSCNTQKDRADLFQAEQTINRVIAQTIEQSTVSDESNIETIEVTPAEPEQPVHQKEVPEIEALLGDVAISNEPIIVERTEEDSIPQDIESPTVMVKGDIDFGPRYYILGGLSAAFVSVEQLPPQSYQIPLIDTLETPETEPTPVAIQAVVFPNPANDRSQIKLTVEEEELYTISLYSAQGQLIREIHNGNLAEQVHYFDLDIPDLANGIYIVNIRTATQNESIQLVKN